uniref:Gastrin-releasing peptide n=1 Tax=Ursus maritimus TaxID=29073 RepID=A0A452TE21_URSMA
MLEKAFWEFRPSGPCPVSPATSQWAGNVERKSRISNLFWLIHIFGLKRLIIRQPLQTKRRTRESSGAPVPGGLGGLALKHSSWWHSGRGGHLMGKKSTGESPRVYEGGSLEQRLQEYIRWEEAARNLLSLLEAKGAGSQQSPQREPLGIPQSVWDYQDDSNFKILEWWRFLGTVGRRLGWSP